MNRPDDARKHAKEVRRLERRQAKAQKRTERAVAVRAKPTKVPPRQRQSLPVEEPQ
jgi:hypothetical protein